MTPPDLAPLLNAIDSHIAATQHLRSYLDPYNPSRPGFLAAMEAFSQSVTNIKALAIPLTYWGAIEEDRLAQIAAGTLAADGVTALIPFGVGSHGE